MLTKKIKMEKINIFVEISDSKQTLFLQFKILTPIIWFYRLKKKTMF